MPEDGAVEVRLTGANPGHVAAQGVDLSVVDDVAVGVSALPAGRGVGGVAGVHQGQRGLHRGVVEVGEEAAHLRGHEHALVDDGATGHGAHVEDLAGKRGVGVGHALDGAAADIELALEVLAARRGLRAAQEGLQDGGHASLGRAAQVVRVHGHLSPEHEGHVGRGAALLEDAARVGDALGVVVREEEHGHAVVALVGQELALLLRLLAEEAVRDLEEHAGAVAGVALQAGAAAVLQVDQDGKRVVQGLVAALALEVRDGADAAGVVLVLAAVQASLAGGLGVAGLRGRLRGCKVLAHGTPLKTMSGRSLRGVRRAAKKRDQDATLPKRGRFSPDAGLTRTGNGRETFGDAREPLLRLAPPQKPGYGRRLLPYPGIRGTLGPSRASRREYAIG